MSSRPARKQRTERGRDLLTEWRALARSQPCVFAEQVLNHRQLPGELSLKDDPTRSWELDQFQRDTLEAIADIARYKDRKKTRVNHDGKNFITIRAAHGPGKTHTAALACHVFNAAYSGRIVATAPKFDQVKTRLWSRFRAISARAEPWYQHLYEINDTTIYWYGIDSKTGIVSLDKNHCILAETANKPENLAGHHEPFQLVVVDEASGIPESLVPTILGALSVGVLQVLLLIGNPTKETGWFADSHRKRETAQQFFRMHVGLHNSERMNAKGTRDWAQKLIDRYGDNSPVVRVRVKGEFPGSSPNQVFALEWIAGARNRQADPIRGDGSIPRLRISVDCGAGGTGETVCTAMRHFDTLRIGLKQTRHSFQLETASKETADAAEHLFDLFGGKKGEDDFVVDSLGVGVGAAGELIARGHKVVTYQGGAHSDNSSRWRVRRVQSYMGARDDFRDACVVLLDSFYDDPMDWDDFDGQLCSIQSPLGTDKVDDLMTKAEMERQGIPSPDMADSWAMQYATQSPRYVPQNLRDESEQSIFVVRSDVNGGLM
jgi:phage terminase large subunit